MTAVEDVPISAAGNPIGFGSMKRVEDQRFVRGQGNYVDDVNLPGMLHSAILRSPFAHARIKSIDTSAAEALPGVVAVITGKIARGHPAPVAARRQLRVDADAVVRHPGRPGHRQGALPGPGGRLRHRRDAATSRRTRSSSSTSTTSRSPPVMDAKKALDADAPVIRDDKGQTDNRITDVHGNQTWESGNKEATEAAFAAAEADPELRRRRGGHPLPARAPGADGDVRLGRRTSTRSPAS